MAYSQFLKARQDVITDRGVEGIIDLADIKDDTRERLAAERTASLDANIFPSTFEVMLMNAFFIPFLGSN